MWNKLRFNYGIGTFKNRTLPHLYSRAIPTALDLVRFRKLTVDVHEDCARDPKFSSPELVPICQALRGPEIRPARASRSMLTIPHPNATGALHRGRRVCPREPPVGRWRQGERRSSGIVTERVRISRLPARDRPTPGRS
jgi:hypothetical protein